MLDQELCETGKGFSFTLCLFAGGYGSVKQLCAVQVGLL